jgi:hypothetical protein
MEAKGPHLLAYIDNECLYDIGYVTAVGFLYYSRFHKKEGSLLPPYQNSK